MIALCPYLGDGFKPAINLSTVKVVGCAIADLIHQAVRLTPLYVPVSAMPGGCAVTTDRDVFEGLNDLHALADAPDL